MGNLKKLKIVGILFVVLIVMLFPKLQALADSVGTYVMPTTTTINYTNEALEASRAKSSYYSDVKTGLESIENHSEQLSDFLGAAQHFSLFANNATLAVDTDGNIAVQTLKSAGHGFDTWRQRSLLDLLGNDDVYIQNLDGDSDLSANVGNTKSSHIVLGPTVNYQSTGGNKDGPMINGHSIDTTTADRIVQEKVGDTPYLDFNEEFTNLKAAADELYDESKTADIVVDDAYFTGVDINKRKIDVSKLENDKNTKAIVIKLDAGLLANDLAISGVVSATDGGKPIYIVVDSNSPTIEVNSKISLYYMKDGVISTEPRSNTELKDFSDSTILWSFTNEGKPVTTLNFNKAWMGSVLAPYATVKNTSDLEGSLICDTYSGGGGSLYRWDWQGRYSPTVTKSSSGNLVIEKYDYDSGKQIISENTENPVIVKEQDLNLSGTLLKGYTLKVKANPWVNEANQTQSFFPTMSMNLNVTTGADAQLGSVSIVKVSSVLTKSTPTATIINDPGENRAFQVKPEVDNPIALSNILGSGSITAGSYTSSLTWSIDAVPTESQQ